jgi:hypothetical protein
VSAASVLTALKAVLPVGTTVESDSVFIQQDISGDYAVWPVLILNVPQSDDDQFTVGPTYQTTHVCHVLYLDRQESSDDPQKDILADADAQLAIMRANLRANPTLTVDGTVNCWEVRRIQRRMAQPLDKGQLGFPALQAEMLVWVSDLPETFD